MATGFRILPRRQVVGPETVARFRDLPVANVSDVMFRMAAGGPRLRPMHAGGVLAGPAFTVKTRPGDNLMMHRALSLAQAGDGDPAAALAALKARDGAAYDAFCETIAAIYFLSPQVRRAVGFPGREPKPARVEVTDLEDLLMPVLEAGFAPRPA